MRSPVYVYIYPKPPAVGEPRGTNRPLLTPNPSRPFHQLDWPTAVKGKLDTLDSTLGVNNPLRTPNPSRPFRQTDWQLATKFKINTVGEPSLDQLSLLHPNPSRPFHQNLWENAPKLPKATGEAQGGNNLLLVPVVVTPAVFRSPLYVTVPVPRKAQADDAVDMLSLLHPPTVQKPFLQTDWPLPQGAKKATGEPLNTNNPLLTPNPAVPFNQDIWDSPTLGRPKSIGESYASSPEVLYPQKPFLLTEWPSSAITPRSLYAESYSVDLSLLQPNPFRPFAFYDWPDPARASLSIKSDSYSIATSPAPFFQTVWDRVPDPKAKATGEPFFPAPALVTPNPAKPFGPFDYFQIKPQAKALVDDVVNQLSLLHPPVVSNPVFQTDWPKPPKPPSLFADSYASPNSLITPNPSQPFNQYIWDSAVLARAKAIGESYGILLTTAPAVPFAQDIWDRPTDGRPKAFADPYATILALFAPNPPQPFKQNLWDSPILGRPKSTGESYGTLLPDLEPNPAQPFRQADWPSDARVPASLKSDSYGLNNPLTTPNPAQPFNLSDWPGPNAGRPKAYAEPFGTILPLFAPNPSRPFIQDIWDNPVRGNQAQFAESFTRTILLPSFQAAWAMNSNMINGLPSYMS